MIDPFSATVIENAELRDRIANLEAALKLARTALHPFASVLFYVKGEVITPADMALKQIDEVLKC